MKVKSLLPILLLISVSGCENETLAPTKKIDEMTDPDAVLVYSGKFSNGPYGKVTGTAEIFRNQDETFEVKLTDFTTTNGPDLYVYVSREAMPVNFISLGKLTSTNGNQVYAVPGIPDFTQYKYVVIHCQKYNHLFGHALVTD